MAVPFFSTVSAGEQSGILPLSRADVPIYRVGDTWSIGTPGGDPTRQTVIEVTPEQTRISMQPAKGSPHELDIDSTDNITKNGSAEFHPNWDLLRFPLTVGATWGTDYTVTRTGQSTLWVAHHVSVDGVDIVHVVAGDFLAFRIVNKGKVEEIQQGKYTRRNTYTYTYWYAPSVKRAIKWDGTSWGNNTESFEKWELYDYSLVDAINPAKTPAVSP